ncbi:MAG: twin-arginine translocase TatA/TatE family subunit [Acidimicrobiales bacterium]
MNIDPEKLLVLFVIAVLVLGPSRLPQAARSLGRGLAELRRYTSSFQSEMRDVLAEPRAMVQSAIREADIRAELHDWDRPGPAVASFGGPADALGESQPVAGSLEAGPGASDGLGGPPALEEASWEEAPGVPLGAPDDPKLN